MWHSSRAPIPLISNVPLRPWFAQVLKNLKAKNLPPKFKVSKNPDKNYRPIPEDKLYVSFFNV